MLAQWDTGRQVSDLDENIAAAAELSQGKSYARTLAEHKKRKENLLEPQFGQALTEYMIEGLSYVEARAILEKSLEAGDGDILVGACTAVECGWFDTMVSPWKHVKGKVRYIRDAANAVRYFDPGDIPIPLEAKEYNDAKLKEREEKQGIRLGFETVVSDLQFASRLPAPAQKGSIET